MTQVYTHVSQNEATSAQEKAYSIAGNLLEYQGRKVGQEDFRWAKTSADTN